MPQRFLKPGITTSDKWNAVSWQAQSLYIRLLTLVDDYGRYDARASVLHGHCFAVWDDLHPNDQISVSTVSALCQQLADNGLITIYESADGKRFLQLTGWFERTRTKSKWPNPAHCAPSASKLPAVCAQAASSVPAVCTPPPSSSSSSSSPSPTTSPTPPTEGKSMVEGEAKPKGEAKRAAKAAPPAEGDFRAWVEELKANPAYQGIDVERELWKMRNWCQAKRKQPTRLRFINWLNNAELPLADTHKPSEDFVTGSALDQLNKL